MPKQYFELVDGKSSKFWHVDVKQNTLNVVYGRIGTAGRESTKEFPDSQSAKTESKKLIQQKTQKGYHKVSAGTGKNHLKPANAQSSTASQSSSSGKGNVKKKAKVKKAAVKKAPRKKNTSKLATKTKPQKAVKPKTATSSPLDNKLVLKLIARKARGADANAIKKLLKTPKPRVTKTQLLNWAGKWEATAAIDNLIAAGAKWDSIAKEDGFRTKSIPIAKRLIADGFKVKSYGTEWISFACRNGQVELASLLVGAGAKPTNDDFLRAIETGKLELVRVLIDAGAKVSAISHKRKPLETTPLRFAIEIGQTAIAKLLLQAGANPNYKNTYGVDLLMTVASDGASDQLELAKLMIEHGVSVDAVTKVGWTSLLWSIHGSPADFTAFLLQNGSDPNRQTRLGTPLLECVVRSQPKHAEQLLAAGADPKLTAKQARNKEHAGKTPLEVATVNNEKKLIAILSAAESGKKTRTVSRSKQKTTSVTQSWKRIDNHLVKHCPAIKKSLNKSASETAIAQLEKRIQAKLPADVRASLKNHNGQKSEQSVYSNSDNGEFYLLSAREIATEWGVWNELVLSGEFEGQTSRPDKGIRDDWFHVKWIPLFANGGGDSICVDLAPNKQGKKGQIILMTHDSTSRKLLATSYKEFLSQVAGKIEDGLLDE